MPVAHLSDIFGFFGFFWKTEGFSLLSRQHPLVSLVFFGKLKGFHYSLEGALGILVCIDMYRDYII